LGLNAGEAGWVGGGRLVVISDFESKLIILSGWVGRRGGLVGTRDKGVQVVKLNAFQCCDVDDFSYIVNILEFGSTK